MAQFTSGTDHNIPILGSFMYTAQHCRFSCFVLFCTLSAVSEQEYEKITKAGGCHPDMWTYLGCCYFMLGMYQEADKVAQKGR